ncbi:CaiB/BaiF CoA-transferase family protein [Spectribacter hydrogenoxidans]|uniref:CaiB/BaiF CoA-transferase family protein n=1 Tax=Spectribacter hydrogenoxidans TaxID=3075608 RepID=A0ABU3BX73_9GAMM|nr:CaiB/BaiF CoA-transferase family protein [Salinisphaera sp. W335]MDT0633901.1 CaiB/BaiF CoA-transferase family protein [Salinisphaera sp. W335]
MSNPLLEGVRILDLTRLLPGPFCTQYLAQLGAEVIKIEDPAGGDYARELMPELFAVVNRGKHSVTLDLREADDVAAFKQLVAGADVVVESFRPGVMERLGCGYETLKAINPTLVYAALTGYGQNGPYRDAAGHDLNYLAYAGALDQIGSAGGAPAMANVQIADLAGGALTAATGILAALLGAKVSGEGTFVDSSMLDGSLALQPIALAGLRAHGHTQPRGADMLTGALPNYQVYKCRDGRYLAVGALEPKFFARLLAALGEQVPLPKTLKALAGGKASTGQRSRKPPTADSGDQSRSGRPGLRDRFNEVLEDPARARRWLAPVRWSLAGVFRLRPRDAWIRALSQADACVAPVLTLEEALADPQVLARGMAEQVDGGPGIGCPLHFEGRRRDPLAPAPGLGDDNDWLLER